MADGDLRQRLSEALKGTVSASFYAGADSWSFSVDPSMVDAALCEFVAWLRACDGAARAEADKAESSSGRTLWLVRAETYGTAADELAALIPDGGDGR